MLKGLGTVSRQCNELGLPLLAIMYPRGERGANDYNHDDLKERNSDEYASLVAHAVRVGAEMGADLIKTQYTGDADSFRSVVKACAPVPVVVAGGAMQTSEHVLTRARDVVNAGGAGVSFGRNVFNHSNPSMMLRCSSNGRARRNSTKRSHVRVVASEIIS